MAIYVNETKQPPITLETSRPLRWNAVGGVGVAYMWLSGRALQQRLGEIEAFYANELNVFTVRVSDFLSLLPSASVRQAASQLVEGSQGSFNKAWLSSQPADLTDLAGRALFKGVRQGGAQNSLAETTFQRTLVSMHASERACLKLAEMLQSLGRLSSDDFMRIVVPIAWNRGDTLIEVGGKHGKKFSGQSAAIEVLKSLISASFGENAAGKEKLQAALRAAMDERNGLPAPERSILERYLFAGARWLAESDVTRPAKPDHALRLGRLPGTNTDLFYDLRESLVTIAPPGAGKSQSHVLRNLLYLKAPAVVLDVKGEMRDGSAKWRSANVGPVHVFDPKNPDGSLKYNPLDFIGTDPDEAWDQARNLADLLVVPPEISRSDAYFEGRARDMITTAILDVALNETGASRSMSGVLDRMYLSGGEEFEEWLRRLEERDVSQLRRYATALKDMPDKQREGIFDSARRQLEIWQSSAIEKLSRETTFDAKQLRASNGTLYLCVALDDIKKFASVLRVIIGQTVNTLLTGKPEADLAPVTFFLDELPKLGRMDVIESTLDAGRGYSVRLWMFCQNIGQLTTVYPNGDGMIANCAARCFMNPDEEAAQRISRNLGEREGLLDGQRKALAESPQLAGTDFANQVLVFMRGRPPARLDKQPAYNDPICRQRMIGETVESSPPQQKTVAPTQQLTAAAPAPTPAALETAPPPSEPAAKPETVAALPEPTPIQIKPSDHPHIEDRPAAPLLAPATAPRTPWLAPAAAAIAFLIGCVVLAVQYSQLSDRESAAEAALKQAKADTLAAQSATDSAKKESAKAVAQLLTALDREKAAKAQTNELDRRRTAMDAEAKEIEARRLAVEQGERALLAKQKAAEQAAATAAPVSASPTPPAVSNSAMPADSRLADRQACDRFAANPTDLKRRDTAPGVGYADLRKSVDAAIETCRRAVSAFPNDGPSRYQLARSFQAANRQEDAYPVLRQLADEGYGAAFDNLAQYFLQRGQLEVAVSLLRRGADAGDADAMVDLAGLIEDRRAFPRYPDEPVRLLQSAANLGHQGAIREVADRQLPAAMLDMFGNAIRTFRKY